MEVVRMEEEHWLIGRQIGSLEVLQGGRQSFDFLCLLAHLVLCVFHLIFFGLVYL